jgi:predicted NAD/FAD-binding protein
MSFAASLDDGALEYSGSSLSSLFVQKRNLVRPRFWQMLADIRRFYRDGPQVLERPDAGTLTLGEYLDAHGYSRAFIHDHLLPMAAAIWSTPAAEMRDYPVAPFVRFCMNHGLMQVTGRPQWRTVVGGSRAYVRRLTAGFADRIRTGTAVRAIRRTAGGAVLEDVRGGLTRFDHVVIAAHADQALAMLADASAAERNVLSAFRYVANDAWLHTDAALMPKRRQCWSSWNYMSRIGDDGRAKVCVSYWMNRLQRLPATPQLFVTLNPHREPAPATVLGRFVYDHPSFDSRAIAAQAELASLQGRNHTWFCGSYFGAGFHEDALTAGLAVAETLGGVRRPWAGHGVPSSAERPWLAEAAE